MAGDGHRKVSAKGALELATVKEHSTNQMRCWSDDLLCGSIPNVVYAGAL